MNDDKDVWDKTLLNDDEFAELMAAEYEADGRPLDDASKNTTWKKLEQQHEKSRFEAVANGGQKTRQPEQGDKFWQVGLALAACIFLSIGLSVIRPMWEEPTSGVKGSGDLVPVELVGRVVGDERGNELFTPGTTVPPATVVPMAHSSHAVYAALVAVTAEGKPEVVIDQQFLPAGGDHPFLTGDEQVFAVDWSGSEREVYCVVAFQTASLLENELRRLREQKSFSFDGSCLVLPEVR